MPGHRGRRSLSCRSAAARSGSVVNDADAQKLVARTPRSAQFDIARVLKKAGL